MGITEEMRVWLEGQKEYHTKELHRHGGHRQRTISSIKRKGTILRSLRKKEKETQRIIEGLTELLNINDWEV